MKGREYKMCILMEAINNDFSHLDEEKKERIRSIVCGGSCGGIGGI